MDCHLYISIHGDSEETPPNRAAAVGSEPAVDVPSLDQYGSDPSEFRTTNLTVTSTRHTVFGMDLFVNENGYNQNVLGLLHPDLILNKLIAFLIILHLIFIPAIAAAGSIQKNHQIVFSNNLTEVLKIAKKNPKPVFLVFKAAWCPICRNFFKDIIRSPEIQAFGNSYYWVQVEVDQHMALSEKYGVKFVPAIIIITPENRMIAKMIGKPELPELITMLKQSSSENVITGQNTLMSVYRYGNTVGTPSGFRSKSICFSHVGYGPLKLASQSPFQSLRKTITPRSPSTLARGEYEWHFRSVWVNIWANSDDRLDLGRGEYGDYFLDYETLQLHTSISYGLTDTVQLELGFEDVSRFGGVMDGFIQEFHDLFGIDQDGRDKVPKDRFSIYVDPGEGQTPIYLDSSDRGTFSRHISLTIQHNLTCGSEKLPAMAYSLSGRYALKQSDHREGSDFDVALSVMTSRRFGWFYGYLTLGYAFFGTHSVRSLPIKDHQLTVLAALEWRYWTQTSILIQYLMTEGLAIDFGPFSKATHELTLGVKREILPNGLLELGLIENLIIYDNSPDFGIHLAYSQRF